MIGPGEVWFPPGLLAQDREVFIQAQSNFQHSYVPRTGPVLSNTTTTPSHETDDNNDTLAASNEYYIYIGWFYDISTLAELFNVEFCMGPPVKIKHIIQL